MAVEFDLPEGFELVEEVETSPTNQVDLPEGFEVITEEATPSIDTTQPITLVGALETGNTTTQDSPFIAGRELLTPDTQPIAPRIIEPKMSNEELQASQAGELVGAYENVFTKYSTLGKQALGLVDRETRDEAEKDVQSLRLGLVKELELAGFQNPRYQDDQLYITVDGADVPVDSSIMRDLVNSSAEIVGAGGAGAVGARAGASVGGLAGAAVGGLVGSAVGASGGRYVDILMNKAKLISDVEDEFIKDQVIEAGLFDASAGIIGAGIIKAGAGTMKGIKHVFNHVVNKNMEGALETAMTHFNISRDEAMELVRKYEGLLGNVEGTDSEKILKVLATTRAGGETIIDQAGKIDPKASSTVANEVFKRAEDVKQASKSLSTDNIQNVLKDELGKYVEETKKYYRDVRDAGQTFTQGYSFDYNKLGVQPILEDIGLKIENPAIKQRYADLMTKVGNATESRSFDDLIDLRQLINEVKFSTKTIKKTNETALNKALKEIDKEIITVANDKIPDAKLWLDSWETSKTEYSKMKQLEKNVMYKALTKAGIDEEATVKALGKYISAGDNTFSEVVEKLPKGVRNRIDGTILDNMVEKFSAGETGGNRAVHFPMLSQELQKISWKNSSPEVKRLVRNINSMSDVFKNDVNLAKVAGNITIPKFQSYLTTDPIVRAKYEFASGVFNYIKRLAPNEQSNALSLVKLTGELLENPLNAKSIKDINKKLPKDTRIIRERLNFDDSLRELQQGYLDIKEGAEQVYNSVDLKETPRLMWINPNATRNVPVPRPTIDTEIVEEIDNLKNTNPQWFSVIDAEVYPSSQVVVTKDGTILRFDDLLKGEQIPKKYQLPKEIKGVVNSFLK